MRAPLARLAVVAVALAAPALARAEVHVIGDTSSSWSASSYFRGNTYYADGDVLLDSFEVYLGLSGACTLDFFLHEGGSETGPWSVVWTGTVSTPAGTGFQASGPVGEMLHAGTYYSLGVGWRCSATYYGQAIDWYDWDAGVGRFRRNSWSNSYSYAATFAPTNHGPATLAYYHRYTVGVPDGDGDGWTTAAGDCDDGDPAVHPGASELCDGLDNDCDGDVDEGFGRTTFYRDADGDGFGDGGAPRDACVAPAGYVTASGDCDDALSTVHPGATELCDGLDNDCDHDVDEDITTSTYYEDRDGDGFGEDGTAATTCDPVPGWVTTGGDCDDDCPTCYPGGAEVCDGSDNDCDGDVDEGLSVTYYADGDGDGWGNPPTERVGCEVPPGYVTEGGDCHDANPAIHPGADELCDGVDNDCDLEVDEGLLVTAYPDEDGDGYGTDEGAVEGCSVEEGWADLGGDCDDADPEVSPAAEEVPDDGVDNDCDGETDEVAGPDGDVDVDADVDGDADAGADADVDGDLDGDGADVPDGGSGVVTVEACSCRAAAPRARWPAALASLLASLLGA